MSAGDRCPVTDMDKAGCAHCRPPAERARLAELAIELAKPVGMASGGTAPDKRIARKAVAAAAQGAPAGIGGRTRGPFPARYTSVCPECGQRIEVGQMIIKIDGSFADPVYGHEECTDA